MRRVLPIVCLALAVPAADAAVRQTVPFRTVVRSAGATAAATERTVRAIRTDRAWRREWAQLHAGTDPRPPRPRVDFARHMLILVAMGRRPTTGYDIAVTSVARRGGRWRVRVDEREPGAGCTTGQAISAPFQVVRVRRASGGVRAVRRRVVEDC